jgi:hypothetical protein
MRWRELVISMELVFRRDEFHPDYYFFFFITMCAFAPDSREFKKFCGTRLSRNAARFIFNGTCLLKRRVPCGTRLYKRQVPWEAICLISFKTVFFFCKIVLKIKLLSKIPLAFYYFFLQFNFYSSWKEDLNFDSPNKRDQKIPLNYNTLVAS